MAKNSKDAYGASGKTNVLTFEPESLHLVDDPAHPLYDERIHLPLVEWMVLNIIELGVIEPIVVWKDPETGKACVVEGRQRVKHTLEANRRLQIEGKKPLLVPGVVRRGSANRMSKLMVSANEIYLPDTPLGRAKKMAAALERGDDEEDLALTFGCSVQTVRATLALLDCTQAVQVAVEAGHVNVTQARQLAAMEPEQQREKVKELVQATSGVSGHERVRRQR
ncbi:ParB/RepB/Spo0J family partition protein, partial [Candidatus Symbiopectobacterium sp. NZEC135]|uniref:ParB/RepB/Spo0J family partition protein n=1 Tax=Candidatus Symbiopectobacterium sp. NZEC135 TaxID=2820471 RepID=UPI0022275DFC